MIILTKKDIILKKDNTWDQVYYRSRNQLRSQVWDQLRSQVWDQVREQVFDQIRVKIWNRFWDHVNNNIKI